MTSVNRSALSFAFVWLQLAPCFAGQPDIVSGWPIAGSNYDREKIVGLDEAIDAGVYKDINSVIVIRDGQLLVERYYNGADRDSTHNPRSVGKTYTATVLGIAIEEGYIDGLDQTLSDFYDLRSFDNPAYTSGLCEIRRAAS